MRAPWEERCSCFVLHRLGAVLRGGGAASRVVPALRRPAALGAPEPVQRLARPGGVFRRCVVLVVRPAAVPLRSGRALLPFGHLDGRCGGAGWHAHVMSLLSLVIGAVHLAVAFDSWRAVRAGLAAPGGTAAAAAAAAARIRRLVTLSLAWGW